MTKSNKKTFNMMLDPLFKAVARSTEARKMIASVISEVTDIKKEDIIKAKFVGGDIPKQNEKEKGKISDIIIYLPNEDIVLLEMNQFPTIDIFKKNTSYAYSIYSQNVRKVNDEVIYPKLYLININNFNAYSTKEAIQYFDFKDQNDVLEDIEGCKSIHLVLDNVIDTRYNKYISKTIIRYAKFLKAKSIEELKNIAEGDEEFMKAEEKVEKLMRDKEFIGLYDKEENDREQRYAYGQYTKKIGHKKGLEEGIVLQSLDVN